MDPLFRIKTNSIKIEFVFIFLWDVQLDVDFHSRHSLISTPKFLADFRKGPLQKFGLHQVAVHLL